MGSQQRLWLGQSETARRLESFKIFVRYPFFSCFCLSCLFRWNWVTRALLCFLLSFLTFFFFAPFHIVSLLLKLTWFSLPNEVKGICVCATYTEKEFEMASVSVLCMNTHTHVCLSVCLSVSLSPSLSLSLSPSISLSFSLYISPSLPVSPPHMCTHL